MQNYNSSLKQQEKSYTCMNYTRPPLAIQVKTIKKAFSDAKRRNVRLTDLTEITKDNISYCKEAYDNSR